MAFLLSWQLLPHGSWKVAFFTASILSSWNATGWAQVTITSIPEKATVGSSITLSVQSVQKNVLSFTWFRKIKNTSEKFCVIRPTDEYTYCEIPDASRVITHLNGSLTLTNLSSEDSGLYLVKVGTLEPNPYYGEKRIQVIDEPVVLQLTLNADYNQKSAIEIKINSTIAFHCQIKSHPVTSYRWTLNGHSLNHTGNQLTLHNVSWAHQGIYTCSSHNKQAQSFNSAKVTLRVVDSEDFPGTSQSSEINIIFLVTTAVLAGLVIVGGLSCILFIRNTKRTSQKQLKDLGLQGESHVASIPEHVLHTYENDNRSQGLHTYENQSQPEVLQSYEYNPQARVGMAVAQDWRFASASSSTPSEKTYQDLDVTKVDVYDQIIHPRRKMSHR